MNTQTEMFTQTGNVLTPAHREHPLPDMRGQPPANRMDTSIAQADRIRELPKTKRDEAALLVWLTERSEQGATDDEIKTHFEWDGDYERPRRWQLVQQDKVRPSSLRRKTKDGNPATVWIVIKAYLTQFADECLRNS